MSERDWAFLEAAWRDVSHDPAPVFLELSRMRRNRWYSPLFGSGEIAIGAAGFAASVWMLWTGPAVAGGLALAFVAITSALSIWSRRLPPLDESGTILATTAAALRNAEISVRYATATLWAVCTSLSFVGLLILLGLGGWFQGPAPYAVGIAVLWLAAWLAGGIVHLRSRSRDLQRLQELHAALLRLEETD